MTSNFYKDPEGLIKIVNTFIYEAFSGAIVREWFSLSQDIFEILMSNLTDETPYCSTFTKIWASQT